MESVSRVGNIVNKTRSTPAVVKPCAPTKQYRISDNVLLSTTNQADVQTDSGLAEQIVYTLSGKKGSNQCRHTRTRTVYTGDPSTSARIVQAGSGVYYDYTHQHSIAVASHSSAVPIAKAAFGVNLDGAVLGAGAQGYINAVADKLRPDLTTVSVPNFLLEIGQIKDLFKLWKSKVSLAKNLAGGHLNYKFGWKPTLGDIQAMVEGVVTFKDRIRDFEASLNVLFQRETVISTSSVTKSGEFTFDTNGKCRWRGEITSKLGAGIAWRPMPLAVLSNTEKTLRGLLDTLGVQLNPRIIWDAFPFTFVIDWFFGVGNWLEHFSVDTLELPIKYVDSYLSYKQEIRVESTMQLDVVSPQVTPSLQCMGSMTNESYFQRMPIFPDYATLSGLGWKKPTSGQFQLLVSLAVVLAGGKKHAATDLLKSGSGF